MKYLKKTNDAGELRNRNYKVVYYTPEEGFEHKITIGNNKSYLTATFTITQTGTTHICSYRDETHYFDLNMLDKIYVDGVQLPEPVYTYNFTTTGEHTVVYYFKPGEVNLGRLFDNGGKTPGDSGENIIQYVTKIDVHGLIENDVTSLWCFCQSLTGLTSVQGCEYFDLEKCTSLYHYLLGVIR